MPVIVKGTYFDKKPPLVCVPVCETSFADTIATITNLADKGVSMMEWRADYFEELADLERVKALLYNVKEAVAQIPFLVTVRSDTQGGRCKFSKDQIAATLLGIAETHVADFIDVEAFFFEDAKPLVNDLHEKGALVIASHHDFEKTGDTDLLEQMLSKMNDLDPDMVKLAVMPQSFSDVLSLMEASRSFADQNPMMPVISISMGEEGLLSRIAGEMTGSVITFGTEKEVSAPGQIPRKDLEEILRLIHKYA